MYAISWMDGFHIAISVGGIVLLVAAVVANRFIPGRGTVTHEPATEHKPVAVEV